MRTLSIILYIAIGLLPIPFLLTEIDAILIVSFLLVSITLCLLFITLDRYGNIVNSAVLVFFSLFFLLAPLLQLSVNGYQLVNTLPLDNEIAIKSNILVLIFLLIYGISFIRFSKSITKDIIVHTNNNSPKFHYLLYFLALVAAMHAATSILSGGAVTDGETDNLRQVLTIKTLYLFPYVCFAYIYYNKKIPLRPFLLITLIFFLLITKNFFFERRNALGPIYLSLILIFFPSIAENTKKFTLLLFFAMVIGFPAVSVLTHQNSYTTVISFDGVLREIGNHFLDLHYDAWANLNATVLYVESNGHTFGKQILGTLLVFIPRSLYATKASPTGEVIGNYLMEYYGMWFNNLSTPIVAEGYIDFGTGGVLILAILTGFFVSYSKKIQQTRTLPRRLIYLYLSLYIMFILRGALMPSIAYFWGAVSAIYIIPTILQKFIYRSNTKPLEMTKPHQN